MTTTRPSPEVEQLAIDAVRVLAMDAVQAAGSGHPGTPMALAPAAYELWTRHLRHNPANPDWLDRDRFVLSLGHASMLLYSVLHLTGYELELEDLRAFRQRHSKTPGHPESFLTPGVETTTGPLGQGAANSVGMALAERWLAARFNRPGHRIIDHHTFAFCSDGDLMEGVSHEAAELAGHQKLSKLVWVFDDNGITIEGHTDLATSTDHALRFEGYGWHVLRVDDGNDLGAIERALRSARGESERPSLIILRTTIAWGSPGKAGHHSAHGSPLGADEVAATKTNLGYPSLESFHVPAGAREVWRGARARGEGLEAEWRRRFAAYATEHPTDAAELERMTGRELPAAWDTDVPDFSGPGSVATRSASGVVLQALAARVPELIGGSADLGSSNQTDIVGAPSVLPATPDGRVFHFGVREHAMGAVMNGMAYHGGIRPFGGTFLVFSDYMRPAVRLAALSGLPVVYVFTHDSIGLGEDGPTHQPVEHMMALRAIPNLMDLRPADPAETAMAWRVALERTDGPSFLALTRQKVPILDRSQGTDAEGLCRGGYVLGDAHGALEAVLIASGSEVQVAVQARELLHGHGIGTRVVSLPSWYLFSRQTDAYQRSVLGDDAVTRVSVEAGATLGWERWIGRSGASVGLDRFGASAPADVLFEDFGFSPKAVAERVATMVSAAREVRAPV